MRVVPFKPEHVAALLAAPTQQNLTPMMANTAYLQALHSGDSWTLIDGDRVIGSGGLVEVWPGLAQAWALISADAGVIGMLNMTRATKRMLAVRMGRIEAYVAADFQAAHHWMRVLGFQRETPGVMRKWFPDGSGAVLYARVT